MDRGKSIKDRERRRSSTKDVTYAALDLTASGLAATNKYGSEGGAGVIVVMTNVSAEKFNSRKNIWNRSKKVTSKKPKKKKSKKKKKKS